MPQPINNNPSTQISALTRIRNWILNALFFRFREKSLRQVHIAQAICLFFLLGSLAYLVFAKHPWEMGIGERLAAGKNPTIDQDIALGFTVAALLTLPVSLIFHQTARWWAQSVAASNERQSPEQSKPGHTGSARHFWILLTLAVLLAGALRLPLASKSLWWDEVWTLQRVVIGQWEKSNDDPQHMEWKQRNWKRAFFYYKKPTNHVPFTVAAKACTHLWQKVTGAAPDAFHEIVFRMPSILAALASVVVIALLGKHLGFPLAGLASAYLLALHPWHIQYGIDGRSFSMVVLFSMLCVLQLHLALRAKRWRNWIAYGFCQMLLLWAFPYALFFCVLLVLGGFVSIAAARFDLRTRWLMAGRFFAANSLSAIGLAFLVSPLVMQVIKWTDDVHGNAMIHAAFLRQLAANLVGGMGWDSKDDAAHFGIPTLDKLPALLIWTILLLAAAMLVAGLILACRKNPRESFVLLAATLAAPLAITVAYFDTHYFYTRYVIYALPFLIFFWAAAIERCGSAISIKSPKIGARWALVLLIAACFLLWSPRIALLLSRPVAPLRDVAQTIKRLDESTPGGVIAAGFNLGGRKPDAYYKHIRYIDDFSDLQRILQEVRTTSKPFYIFYGYESFNRAEEPEPFHLLDDPSLFQKTAEFYGIEPDFHYQLYKFVGGKDKRDIPNTSEETSR